MAKPKVDVEVTATLTKRFEKALAEVLPLALKITGTEAVRLIGSNTRAGRDLTAGGKKNAEAATRQPKLSARWIAQRERISKHNTTSDVYGPTRSNLSLTGQLINALTFKVVNNAVVLEVAATPRTPYKHVPTKGPNKGKAITYKTPADNRTLAQYLSEQGRYFVGLTNKEKAIISNQIRQLIRRQLAD